MNIALVTASKIWSGVKTWMLEFGVELHRRGHRIHVFASDEHFLGVCRDHGLEIQQARFGPDYNPAAILRFRLMMRSLNVHVACMNLNKDLRTAGIAARALGIPVVHRVGLVGDLSAKWDARLTQHFLVDGILVTSQWLKEALLQRYRFLAAERIHTVHNGKRLVPPLPEERLRGRVRFVVASRLAHDKNHLDVLEACASLRAWGHANFSCDIFGEGPMRPALQEAIARMGLSGIVTLHGFAADVAHRLHAYDFGLLPSRREALSNALLEFQAAGVPVIASRVGAAPEVISHGDNGYLFEPGDVDVLAARMRTCLFMDPATYRGMSEAALRVVRQRFDLHNVVGELEAYLHRMADTAERQRDARSIQAA